MLFCSEIKIFNRKLCKLAKIFSPVKVTEADDDRKLFTTHGLHLNRLDKELFFSHLLLHIYSALEVDTGSTMALAWQASYSQVSSTIWVIQDLINQHYSIKAS
jgi:hypothetical protein